MSKNDANTALVNKMSLAVGRFEFDAHPISTLRAPSGVTNIGGANVYAAKLATGVTVNVQGSVRFEYHTLANNHCIRLSVEWFRDTQE